VRHSKSSINSAFRAAPYRTEMRTLRQNTGPVRNSRPMCLVAVSAYKRTRNQSCSNDASDPM
jgi:hypothetical protein